MNVTVARQGQVDMRARYLALTIIVQELKMTGEDLASGILPFGKLVHWILLIALTVNFSNLLVLGWQLCCNLELDLSGRRNRLHGRIFVVTTTHHVVLDILKLDHVVLIKFVEAVECFYRIVVFGARAAWLRIHKQHDATFGFLNVHVYVEWTLIDKHLFVKVYLFALFFNVTGCRVLIDGGIVTRLIINMPLIHWVMTSAQSLVLLGPDPAAIIV